MDLLPVQQAPGMLGAAQEAIKRMSINNPSAFAMVEPKAELDMTADSPAIRFRRHEQPLIAERRPWQHDLETTAVDEDGHDGNSDLAAFEAQYELGRKLGSGAFGSVHVARCRATGAEGRTTTAAQFGAIL